MWADFEGVPFREAYEEKASAREVLKSHKKPPVHVFRNIHDKMTREVNDVLDGLDAMPFADDDSKKQAFGEMKQYLTEVEPNLFPPEDTMFGGASEQGQRFGWCDIHKKWCPMWKGRRVSAQLLLG